MFCPNWLLYNISSILLGVTAGYYFFLSLCLSGLAHFSAVSSVAEHGPVLFFTGSDVTLNITTHMVKYTPQDTLHGNHEVSLSRGFVKYNIIQRGQGCQIEGTLYLSAAAQRTCCLLIYSQIIQQMCVIVLINSQLDIFLFLSLAFLFIYCSE